MPKKFSKKLFIVILTAYLFGLAFLVSPNAKANTDFQWTLPDIKINISGNKKIAQFTQPKPCPDEPDKMCINWISEYIAGIYSYAIGIVGILAAVVLMIGGIIWLTAGGNQTRIGTAKSYITASLTGLVIALSSYLILYQINPELIKLIPIKVAQVTGIPSAEIAAGDTCAKYNTTGIISFNTSEKTPLPSSCNKYDFTKVSDHLYINTLKAIAAAESGCNPNLESQAGACGIMQLLPSTAQKYNKQATCQWLKDHPQESITIASFYIGGSGFKDNERIFAGYNGGYGATTNSGKKGPLAWSSDCLGVVAYQCCKNPGELAETQNYIFTATKYYNSLN